MNRHKPICGHIDRHFAANEVFAHLNLRITRLQNDRYDNPAAKQGSFLPEGHIA
ncbi:hypothetical protein [Bradyrhizobium icense]|uniref:hypothetical protein n=1 Tax=Bradyrhizobium icense TaxID=1274631 RepID=UPI0012E99413|nr:hypothetical protein [Bradyrhizobium icense]